MSQFLSLSGSVIVAWRKELQTSAESSSKKLYSITMTTQRLSSLWPVTCLVQSETRSVCAHTQRLQMNYHHIKAGICQVNYSEQIELCAINQQMETYTKTHTQMGNANRNVNYWADN